MWESEEMTYINQHVLNNLFYILVSIFFFYFLYDHVRFFQQKKAHQHVLLIACLSVPLILCMKYPIYIAPDCVHDLRQVPFLIGTFYGGWAVSVPLLLILLVARFMMYGYEFITVAVYVMMCLCGSLFSPFFQQLTRKQRLVASAAMTFLLAIAATVLAVAISDFQVTESYVVDFILVPPVAMLFVVFIIETLREALFIRSKAIKLEKMEVVSQLAASISHEIRNPLTVVKGFMQLMKAKDISAETKEQYMNIALEELNRACMIIDDYLTFAKPFPEKIETLHVERELEKVIDMLRPFANMYGVQIVATLMPATMEGNAQYFRQCFLNIIKNGIEATTNGGKVYVDAHADGKTVTIVVRDEGEGMTKEQLARFGEPYFSTKEKGTGLGAMVSIRIIEMMNGTWRIQSEKGRGTTMTVSFSLLEK
ncbi:HAMP domain-containing sensor histidine kinase [Anoxybacillus sp. CHMUD]|uniref:sensor histidine kinase n=1 Tax=Anoxybacillus sp. CHMUD TaxID=2508870 RepID=UPI0010094806|nr:HAMP domain-containing sensor histidine kinase [Anoxybacillus sp. CHMUD]NNU91157.1 HAMP domain-containing histidine kinase [Anoxybacillus sp. CHMUD]QAV26222.1 two-component sensor histidine kinase [Neobacillus thermocopriae]